jgi:hypothetical protein
MMIFNIMRFAIRESHGLIEAQTFELLNVGYIQ